jgi:hypothetical protein
MMDADPDMMDLEPDAFTSVAVDLLLVRLGHLAL